MIFTLQTLIFYEIMQKPLFDWNLSLDKIKVENRNHIFSKLETGDIIKTKAQVYPLINHYGIVQKDGDKLDIWHLQTDKVNSKGGNVVKESLDQWIKGRDIVSVEKTSLKTSDLKSIYEALSEHKYSPMHFNCEHFVNFAKGKGYISTQTIKWTSVAIIGALVYYLIRTRKI